MPPYSDDAVVLPHHTTGADERENMSGNIFFLSRYPSNITTMRIFAISKADYAPSVLSRHWRSRPKNKKQKKRKKKKKKGENRGRMADIFAIKTSFSANQTEVGRASRTITCNGTRMSMGRYCELHGAQNVHFSNIKTLQLLPVIGNGSIRDCVQR